MSRRPSKKKNNRIQLAEESLENNLSALETLGTNLNSKSTPTSNLESKKEIASLPPPPQASAHETPIELQGHKPGDVRLDFDNKLISIAMDRTIEQLPIETIIDYLRTTPKVTEAQIISAVHILTAVYTEVAFQKRLEKIKDLIK